MYTHTHTLLSHILIHPAIHEISFNAFKAEEFPVRKEGITFTGIDRVRVGVHGLGLLLLRQVLLILVRCFRPSLRRRAGGCLEIDRTSGIRSGTLRRRRTLQPTAPLVDGRGDARHRVQLRVRIRGLQGEGVLRVGVLRRGRRWWTVTALEGAPTVVDLVLDEPDDLAEGIGRPAAPALDGVWGRGALRGFRCNRQNRTLSFRPAGILFNHAWPGGRL